MYEPFERFHCICRKDYPASSRFGEINAFCRVQSIERGTAGGGRGFICQPANAAAGTLKLRILPLLPGAAVGLLFILRAGRNHADPDALREFNESEGMGFNIPRISGMSQYRRDS